MKVTPVKGTNDYLPEQMLLRDKMQQAILSTFSSCGFLHIATPALEDVENLTHSDGGDNLNLIYKILKRGEKLEKALENSDYENLADLGLRYDLTLPLTRFYSANKDKLPLPFKCIQMDKVYRAERPQKGRLREFMQCDIDVIGSSDKNCEVELILTISKTLKNLGLKNFTIILNDRNIVKEYLKNFGFNESDFSSICISLDKLDKIGLDGVKEELLAKEYEESCVSNLIGSLAKGLDLQTIERVIPQCESVQSLKWIMDKVAAISDGEVKTMFDLTLIRGQGYYTGTVFEIHSEDYHCALGGGGRYDNLIGKFLGTQIPAVGFSIGFERIFSLLEKENQLNLRKKIALIYNDENFVECYKFGQTLTEEYDVSVFKTPNKLGKFLNRLKEIGFTNFCNYSESKEIKELN